MALWEDDGVAKMDGACHLFFLPLKYDRPILVSFTFIGGMRNISAGSVIAITYSPPEGIVPVVTGMIFQQAISSLYASFLDRHYHQKAADKSSISA